MSGPGYADIPVYHGDTLTFAITFPDPTVDVTGHEPLFQVRNKTTLLADWSEFVTVTDPLRIDIVVPGDPDEDGTGLLPRPTRCETPYPYDFQLTSPDGTVRTILRGYILLSGDVSHG